MNDHRDSRQSDARRSNDDRRDAGQSRDRHERRGDSDYAPERDVSAMRWRMREHADNAQLCALQWQNMPQNLYREALLVNGNMEAVLARQQILAFAGLLAMAERDPKMLKCRWVLAVSEVLREVSAAVSRHVLGGSYQVVDEAVRTFTRLEQDMRDVHRLHRVRFPKDWFSTYTHRPDSQALLDKMVQSLARKVEAHYGTTHFD